MSTIEVAVAGRGIQVKQGYEKPSAGDVNTCSVSLAIESGGVWDSLPHKRVTFSTRTASVTVDYAPTITIPHEVMASPGALYLTLTGYDADGIEVARTHRMTYPIEVARAGADEGAEPTPATLDVVSRIDAIAADLEEKRDTDYWRGEPGTPGEPGKDADIAGAEAAKDAANKAAEAAIDAAASANSAASEAHNAATKANEVEAKLTGNILKGKAKDTFVHVDDAFPSTLLGIDIEGTCKQDGTPSPDNPIPIQVVENPVVKVTGRNLWPFASSYTSIEGHQNEFVKDKTPFTILPGTYTFSAAGSLGDADAPLFGYTSTGKRIQLFRIYRNVTNPKYSFTVTEPITSVFFISNAAVSSVGTISNIQLERNSNATEYEPHASQTLTFTLPSEHPYLAKMPDGTADEITVDRDGNVELVARVQKYDTSHLGAANDVAPLDNGLNRYSYWNALQTPAKNNSPCMTPNFASVVDWSFPSQGCYTSGSVLFVGASADPTDTLRASGYLYCTIATPTRYSLGKIEMPKAQDSIINVWTDAEVTPSTGIEYTRDVNIVISNLESAIASITEG